MQNWLRRTFWIALIVSILLHVIAALFMAFFKIPMPGVAQDAPIEVFDAKNMQIADQMLKGNRQVPKKAEHVGIDDNATVQETVARPQPHRPSSPSQLKSPPQQQATEQKPQRQQRQSPPQEQQEAPKQRRQVDRTPTPRMPFNRDSMYAMDPNLFSMKQPNRYKDTPTQYPSRQRQSMPRTAVSSAMNVESQAYLSEDYYPNYSYGSHTYLNVLKYPDVEYFVRLKRAFRQTWNPIPAVQRYYMGGGERRSSIAVVLGVTVDPNGNMSELFVLRGSGSSAYDEEALRTVRSNSPFSAPPSNILKDGLLRMSWTFIVYM